MSRYVAIFDSVCGVFYMCDSVLQCVAVCFNVLYVLQCDAERCSVVQRDAVCWGAA